MSSTTFIQFHDVPRGLCLILMFLLATIVNYLVATQNIVSNKTKGQQTTIATILLSKLSLGLQPQNTLSSGSYE